MGDEEEYIEIDIRKKVLDNLKDLGMNVEFVDTIPEIEDPPYSSGYFAGQLAMVENLGIIHVKNQNFDYIHIVRRG